MDPVSTIFEYDHAFSRNLGWVTQHEQQILRTSRIAIAGMGGVGCAHLLTLARLGVGEFRIADLDRFEIANFNRQFGASMSTIGRDKVEVMAGMARDINPEISLKVFERGIHADNIDAFLGGANLFVDGFDFFALDIRSKVFARAAELGIPAITAAPIGFGTAYLIFMPGRMTFERYFRFAGLPEERKYVNFAVGLTPKGFHRPYLVDPSRLDLAGRRGPSTVAAIQLCAGAVAAEAAKILLGRGKVHAAPCYHQFDAWRGRWTRGRLLFGNAGPLQGLKRQIGYRAFARLSRNARPAEDAVSGSEMERIIDAARWSPSGDNAQPWTFHIDAEDRLSIDIRASSTEQNVYEYNDGQPTLLSAGMLLESLRIAASRFRRSIDWHYDGVQAGAHRLTVRFAEDASAGTDPLHPYLPIRSVDRTPYRLRPLDSDAKASLEAAIGRDLRIRWSEPPKERWRMARLSAAATDIRLRIPEAYAVHQRILDWDRRFSPDGVPVTAVGLDPLMRVAMRNVMQSWSRADFMNRFLGGTMVPRIELDLIPGLCCAAHFAVTCDPAPGGDGRIDQLLRAGMCLQRFWLSATQRGLVLQPALAVLCFAQYGAAGTAFTASAAIRRRASDLAVRLTALTSEPVDRLVFLGRIGWPFKPPISRSVRRPMTELVG